MVTAMSFPYIRPRRSSSYRKKGPRRPPTLKVQTSFFPGPEREVKKIGTFVEPILKAAEESNPIKIDHKEEDEAEATAEERPKSLKTSTKGKDLKNLAPAPLNKRVEESEAMTEPEFEAEAHQKVSPQGSPYYTNTHLDDDSDDADISPISDDRPPVRRGSGLRRFFPELANNVDLISPTGADKQTKHTSQSSHGSQGSRGSLMESELEERVHNLCRSPRDEIDYLYGQKTSSSVESDAIFDCASSCYSRRSSFSSVNTEYMNNKDDYPLSAGAYSIISPTAAGVFDDSTSACPSRASSRASRLNATAARSATTLLATDKGHSRRISDISMDTSNTTNTINDPKNKPLPLEPISEPDIAPSPLAVRRHSSRMHTSKMHLRRNYPGALSIYSESSPSHPHHSIQRSATTINSPSTTATSSCQACHACGVHSSKQRSSNRSQWADRMQKGEPHIRQLPSLAQAAEELEDVLADLNKQGSKQRTVLILDGPLQVSRHNGDLVATRPAPQPPSTKPHSMTHPPLPVETLRPSNFSTKCESEKHKTKPKRSSKVQRQTRPLHLAAIPESESQKQDEDKNRGHQKSQSADDQPVSMVGDRRKGSASESVSKSGPGQDNQCNAGIKDEDDKKDKAKKTFGFSMKTFKRSSKHRRSATGPLFSSSSSLSPSSDASFDPPCHPSHRQLSASDPTVAEEDPTVIKGTDLRLQLPRLQTRDLELGRLQEHLDAAGRGVAQSSSGSPNAHASTSDIANSSPQTSPTHSASFRQETWNRHQSFTPPEEKIVVDTTMMVPERARHTQAFISTAQASSVQLPSDQIYELAATPPSPTSTLPQFATRQPVEANINFPTDFPKHLTFKIMQSIDSLDDLFNFVLVNKRFYSIFKQHELPMIKNALFKMSPPAWELREMSPPWATETQLLEPDSRVPEYTASLYLERYAQDIYTLAKLKSMILVRCSPFLRRDTIRGLSGLDLQRAEDVDDAFWRIWTFCRLFGSNKGRENDLEGQVDWLRGGVKASGQVGAMGYMTEPFGMSNVLFEPPEGFGRGNGAGLSPKQLYDMTEIWTCMSVLLQPLHGKCIEARRVGIYEGMDVPANDPAREEQVLEEWTSFVLTIGLSAVLGLSSLAPAEATADFFNHAKTSGLTKWAPTETDTSRSSFLKEAVSRVYEDHERNSPNGDGSPADSSSGIQLQHEREQRHAAYKQELRARRARGRELGTGFSSERPMSEFSTIVHNLDGTDSHAPPVPALPSLMLDRASTSTTSSTGPPPRTPNHTPPPLPAFKTDYAFIPPPRSPPMQHPSLFPPPPQNPAPIPTPMTIPRPSLPPQVQDPVDRAINHMVNELGFDHEDVKWALKITDTGEGLDVAAAESLLVQQKQKKKKPFARKESLLHSVMKRQRSTDSGWRFV